MRLLCEAYTTGGPVAILQQGYLTLWDGDEDYFGAIARPRNGCLQVLLNFKARCALCLFHQESDGNFHVYFDSVNFLVLSEISADEGYEVNHHLPPIHQAVVKRAPITLPDFGGKVVLFDATIPGHTIDLNQVGCAQAQLGPISPSQRYDIALIDVELGDWQARELFLDTPHLSFSGVWFQRTC